MVETYWQQGKAEKELFSFQEYLASLVFLDPACGSDNFLTESYLSLRRLENEIIKELYNSSVSELMKMHMDFAKKEKKTEE